ncbi:MAG: DUF4118 domain-containing protein [Bacillota bacterium]|nr:DUF4118 domain-containing protein [Bacillota bacterium]
MGKQNMDQEEKDHILACISSSPSNARIIRTAARMARAFDSQFTALFVETPDFSFATEENKKRVEENCRLAERLGANIETVYGDDIPFQIAEFARISGITQIVLGQSAATHKYLLQKQTLTQQLLSYAPEIDIHIIPDTLADTTYHPKKVRQYSKDKILKNTVKSVLILLGASALSLLFHEIGFTRPNIIMVYILGVLLTSIATSHRAYSLISSIASVFIFNYLFTEPRFTLAAYETGYPVTFVIMFLTAYITGTFAIRYKEQARQSAKIAHRTKILFDTDQLLSKTENKEEILHTTGQQIEKMLGRSIVIFDHVGGELSEPMLFPEREAAFYEIEKERQVAQWVLHHNHAAGAKTERFSDARYRYLAIRVNQRVYAVIGIDARDGALDASENSILLSILGETALALENEKNAREKEAAAVLAESEQLRANLLRSISHDLRTPLTTISGNADNLLQNGSSIDEETKRLIYADIYEDSMWLINLVENLLYSTRIEEGRMSLNTSLELVSEIMEETMRHIRPKAKHHVVTASCEDDILLVMADARLIVQVIINLVDNALKYTPEGSSISIHAAKCGEMAEIQIADNGHGISDFEKERIFDKFYCGEHEIADNRRSLGLGLYLCKVIIEAHGGEICVTDNQPHGAVFRFTLPLEEVRVYE